MGTIAILGGTGPEGIGLGLRFALAGESVRLGSRDPARAAEAAARATARLAESGCSMKVLGFGNPEAVRGADMIVFSVPFVAVDGLVRELGNQLVGRLIVDVVNPLVHEHGLFRLAPVRAGSVGEHLQSLLPDSDVVSAFKNASAEDLLDIAEPMDGDVLLCGRRRSAREAVADLVQRIPDLRPVDAGGIGYSRALEWITALLVDLNHRHHAVTSIRIVGLRKPSPEDRS